MSTVTTGSALQAAVQDVQLHTVHVVAGVYEIVEPLVIRRNLTLRGEWAEGPPRRRLLEGSGSEERVVLDGLGASNLLVVYGQDVHVRLENLHLRNGSLDVSCDPKPGEPAMCGGGGVTVYRGASLTLIHVTISQCETYRGNCATGEAANEDICPGNTDISGYGGGALYASGSDITIIDSALQWNTATRSSWPSDVLSGGHIFVLHGSKMRLVRSSVGHGEAGNAGGIAALSSWVTIEDSHVHDNVAYSFGSSGGGIRMHSGHLNMSRSLVSANRCSSMGGGMMLQGSSAYVDTVTFERNYAPSLGAALCNIPNLDAQEELSVLLSNCTFRESAADVSSACPQRACASKCPASPRFSRPLRGVMARPVSCGRIL